MPKIRKMLSKAEEDTAKWIRENYGGMLTATEVSAVLGTSINTTKKFLSGVDSVQIAGRRRYTCTDLARKIEAARVPGGGTS